MKKSMSKSILTYREDAVHHMVYDIEYLEKNGLSGDDLWDAIDINNYSIYSTEDDKVRAFEMAGYTVS